MPDLAADLELIVTAAQEAGQVALGYWRRDPQVWDKGDDQGPVTEADLAADAHLKARLLAARPGYGWISEESAAVAGGAATFIVDPIDGTRGFAAGEPTWAVAVAVAVAGQPVAGAVVLPARDKIYAAAKGSGARFNGARIRARTTDAADGATILSTKATLHPDHWRSVPRIDRHFRNSLAYRQVLVAEGRFDGMLTLRDTWIWDVAAGAVIAAEAGATVTDARGQALRLDLPKRQVSGVMIAPRGVHTDLLQALAVPAA